jgi:HEAT repeat protein
MQDRGFVVSFARARAIVYILAALCLAAAGVPLRAAPSAELDTAFTNLVRGQTHEVREQAAKTLIKGGSDSIEPMLRQVVNEPTRRAAQSMIEKIGTDAYPELIRLMGDEKVAQTAGSLLFFNMGPEGARYAPELLACARGKSAVRNYCAQALVRAMSPKAKGQAGLLIEALTDDRDDIRALAAAALGQIGPKAKKAAPALGAALRDPSVAVRAGAAQALTKLGPAAKDALQDLEKAAASDPNEQVRKYAVDALKELHGS